jgi:hypothetical protein
MAFAHKVGGVRKMLSVATDHAQYQVPILTLWAKPNRFHPQSFKRIF